MTIEYKAVGDQGLLMEFENKISPEISGRIRGIMDLLEEDGRYKDWGIRELIPTYRSILVLFDPLISQPQDLVARLEDLASQAQAGSEVAKRILVIPTLYGGEVGPDLDRVADNAGLGAREVIDIHKGVDYLVYMLGFTPGFTYLGGLDSRIHTPRLEKARIKIPAGSVGIADAQTGIYPIDSPGGWQLIGRTPLELMIPEDDPPVLVRAGDYIRFREVDQEEYEDILAQVQAGTYEVEIIRDDQGGDD